MQFWSNVEKEYNDLFDNKDDPDEGGPEDKKEQKGGSDSEEDDEPEFGEIEEKKALNAKEAQRKRKKRCRIGDKTYEVGERWTDPETGKDMICILMNVPKKYRARLAEADVTVPTDPRASDSGEAGQEPGSPGVQWAYTNKLPKGQGPCVQDKLYDENADEEFQVGNKDSGNQGTDDQNKTKEISEDDLENLQFKGKLDYVGKSGVDDDNNNEAKLHVTEDKSNSETEDKKATEQSGKVDQDTQKPTVEENVSETGSDEESGNEEDSGSGSDDEKETIKDESRTHGPSKSLERSMKLVEDTSVKPEDNTDHNKTAPENTNVDEESTSQREKGQTIYTKETTVTQKKLFKTEETIESVETERNHD